GCRGLWWTRGRGDGAPLMLTSVGLPTAEEFGWLLAGAVTSPPGAITSPPSAVTSPPSAITSPPGAVTPPPPAFSSPKPPPTPTSKQAAFSAAGAPVTGGRRAQLLDLGLVRLEEGL